MKWGEKKKRRKERKKKWGKRKRVLKKGLDSDTMNQITELKVVAETLTCAFQDLRWLYYGALKKLISL